MAKSNKRKRSSRKNKQRDEEESFDDDEYEDDDSDYDSDYDDEIDRKTRKRSQAPEKKRMSHKKQDRIVLIIAAIFVIGTLAGYYYFGVYSVSDDDDNGGSDDGTGNFTGTILVVSDTTHNYGQSSWHILKANGHTNFIIKVENTGTRDDTYKLNVNNLNTQITIDLDNNNFKLKPGRSTPIIVTVSTTLNYEYRLPAPITVDLVSGATKSVLGTVDLDLTVKVLDETLMTKSGDKVAAFYSGAMGTNGSLFDYSMKNPEAKDPLYISLSDEDQWDNLNVTQYMKVIPGFMQGIIGMVPGETHTIAVPPELGYQPNQGPAELIGITLLFEVQLISNDRLA
jgi:hypothetical protein